MLSHAQGAPYITRMRSGLLYYVPACYSVFHAMPGIYNIEFDDSESAPLLFYGFSFSLDVARGDAMRCWGCGEPPSNARAEPGVACIVIH